MRLHKKVKKRACIPYLARTAHFILQINKLFKLPIDARARQGNRYPSDYGFQIRLMERGVYRVIARPPPVAAARRSFPARRRPRSGGLSFSDSLFLAPQTVGRAGGRSVGGGKAASSSRSSLARIGKSVLRLCCGTVFLRLRPQTDGRGRRTD